MTELIACLSTGKGSWAQVSKLMQAEKWEKIILIANEFAVENFRAEKGVELILLRDNKAVVMRDMLINELKNRIKGAEVALNIISGNGKEHMALISALLRIGVGIRFVNYDNGIEEI